MEFIFIFLTYFFISVKGEIKMKFNRRLPSHISSDNILEIENEIMEVSLLIDYLRSNGLIYLIEDSKKEKPKRDIANFDKQNYPYEITKELDQKVATELYQSMNHRIFVGQTLKDYVANGFKTIEDLTFEEVRHQTEETKNLVSEAQKQSKAAQEQVGEAKRQADAADQQVKEAARQADAAELQVKEAEKQTRLVQTQTDNAQTQTKLAQKQTRSAQWQTIISLVAVVLSIIAIIVGSVTNIWVASNITMDVKVDSTQVEQINDKLGRIKDRIDSLVMQPEPLDKSKSNKKSKK